MRGKLITRKTTDVESASNPSFCMTFPIFPSTLCLSVSVSSMSLADTSKVWSMSNFVFVMLTGDRLNLLYNIDRNPGNAFAKLNKTIKKRSLNIIFFPQLRIQQTITAFIRKRALPNLLMNKPNKLALRGRLFNFDRG